MGKLRDYTFFFFGVGIVLSAESFFKSLNMLVEVGERITLTDSFLPPPMVKRPYYHASEIEDYIMQEAQRLGYNETLPENRARGCDIFKDPSVSTIYSQLQSFRSELDDYNKRLKNFKGTVKDLRKHLDDPGMCESLELHKEGLPGIFRSGSLSQTSTSGFVEPLLPILRHPNFCFDRKQLMSLDYLVHDFAVMCRKLKPTSRTVFIDMGASLDFHKGTVQPNVYVTQLFQKFGFRFDHIYAYEVKHKEPAQVFEKVPDELKAAYHWINVGVSSDPKSGLNPLKM
jgi:hypothetical protein